MARRSRDQNGEPLLAESRRTAILEILRSSGAISVTEVQERLGISSMTARRDLNELARRGLAQRTHGGAVIPSISTHEDSFTQRLESATEAKAALAEAAAELLSPGQAIFIDSSTTGYFLARRILDRGIAMTMLTNSLPVMQMVAGKAAATIELIAAGGVLRPLTQSFVGPCTVRTVQDHFADHAFVSVKAVMPNGVLADPDPLEAEVKRSMIGQASRSVLLIDRSKLSARGLSKIVAPHEITLALAYGVREAELEPLARAGVVVQAVAEPDRDRTRRSS